MKNKMKIDDLQNQYNGQEIKMDGSYIMKLNEKYGINRYDFAIKLIDKYNLFGKNKFLDIGCGDGDLCKTLENKFNNIYGIEIIQDRIDRFYKKYTNSNIKLTISDLNNKLNFDNETFDCIISLVVLDWVYDLNNALKEINRILKKDGIFILEVSNLGFLIRRIKLLFGIYPKVSAFSKTEWTKIGWDASVCHTFTKKELQYFLEEFGFETIEVSGTGFLYKLRNWWPGLLCGDLFYVLRKK